MKNTYNAKIIKESNSTFSVSFPSLDGCFSCADTFEEALFNAKEACELWLEGSLQENMDIPKPDKLKKGLYAIEPNNHLQVALAIKFSDKSISDIARDMGTSWAGVQRLMKKDANPTLKQLEKLSLSLGKRVSLEWK